LTAGKLKIRNPCEEAAMNRTISISEAGARLADISDEFARAKKPRAVKVTRDKKPVLAIMPWELYEGLIETLEILRDKEFMADIRESAKELREGKTIPWKDVKRELGL
jgi:antitoxin YefM